jgi:hypothetical protein
LSKLEKLFKLSNEDRDNEIWQLASLSNYSKPLKKSNMTIFVTTLKNFILFYLENLIIMVLNEIF